MNMVLFFILYFILFYFLFLEIFGTHCIKSVATLRVFVRKHFPNIVPNQNKIYLTH